MLTTQQIKCLDPKGNALMATLRLLRGLGLSRGLICAMISMALASGAAAQFNADSKWIPGQANSLVLINATRIFASPLATKENWAAQRLGAFERGLSLVPFDKGRVMLASQIDYEHMEPIWTAGVFFDEESAIDLTAVAQRHGQQAEELAGHQAVLLPGDHYLIELEPKLFGIKAPANRQATSRWVAESEASAPRLSPYLSNAIAFADRNAHVIIAFDLSDAISQADARSRLLQVEGLRASNIESLATAASRMSGVTLGVNIGEAINGSLRIDFKPGTEGIDRISKDLILGILSDRGLMIDDLLDWELASEASRLVLKGPMSNTGLRQISLLVNQPVRVQLTNVSPGEGSGQKEISVGKATRQFIDTINLYFAELDEFVQNPRAKHAKVYARWFDKYANKIDSLSLAGVDPEIVPVASDVSAGLREVSRVLTYAELSTLNRQTTERGGVYGDYGGYGYYGYGYGYGYRRSNAAVREAVRTQETTKVAATAKETMEKLRGEVGDARRQMSIKYPEEF
jgi:hypothetical protein